MGQASAAEGNASQRLASGYRINSAADDAERASLLLEINNIADSSKFNGRLLLDGTFKDIIAQVGANADEYIDVDIEKIEGIKLGEYWNLGFENNDFS
jgi:flagellin-like hook-associated protein FlgL